MKKQDNKRRASLSIHLQSGAPPRRLAAPKLVFPGCAFIVDFTVFARLHGLRILTLNANQPGYTFSVSGHLAHCKSA
jgi:hypothetical protein